MTKDDVTIEERRDGLRIIIEDKATDSLAILEVTRSTSLRKIMAKVGLRGNFSMERNRGLRYVYTNMDAPPVSEPDRLRRKAAALERGGRAIKERYELDGGFHR